MPRPKGLPKTGGRKKNTPNKLTADLKAMVLEALKDAGGKDYLLEQASENPNAFLALIGRILPLQVGGDPANPIRTVVVHRFTEEAHDDN